MFPKTAVIKTGKKAGAQGKLFGQYPLERIIRMLWQAGFSKIYLKLDAAEEKLYTAKICGKLGKRSAIVFLKGTPGAKPYLELDSKQFFQYKAFAAADGSFKKTGNRFTVKQNSEQFILSTANDYRKASRIAVENIRMSAGGWIARTINKRISIPISLVLSKTGVHPNVLTFINFIIGMSGALLFFRDDYYSLAAAGLLIQGASVFDGCDGEVAKMTTKFSKLGGLLDSLSDHSLAIVAVIGSVYQMYLHLPFEMVIASAVFMAVGVSMSMGGIFYYLFKYSESRSFVAYDKEFYDFIPKKFFMIRFMGFWKYILRKECYSLLGCFFCLAGIIHYFAFFVAVVLFFGGFLVIATNVRFFPIMGKFRKTKAMIYISKRK